MSVEVPSEPCLQHQISTGVQYYIPGGHSDRRGRGVLCTGRGRSHCAFHFSEHPRNCANTLSSLSLCWAPRTSVCKDLQETQCWLKVTKCRLEKSATQMTGTSLCAWSMEHKTNFKGGCSVWAGHSGFKHFKWLSKTHSSYTAYYYRGSFIYYIVVIWAGANFWANHIDIVRIAMWNTLQDVLATHLSVTL